MQNLPNIGPMEVAVVSLATVVLCFAPAVLAWTDARRRRRAEELVLLRAALAVYPDASVMPAPEAAGQAGEGTLAEGAAAPEQPHEPRVPVAEAAPSMDEELSAPVVAPARPAPAEISVPEVPAATAAERPVPEAPAPEAPASVLPSFADVAADEERGGFRFRLDELRRVRLPDWPPAEVRNDSERHRVWQEAQHVAEQAVVSSAQLALPFPVQSVCLGQAAVDGPRLRLQLLLFAELWPVSPTQAVAAAVFEVDSASGEIRGRAGRLKHEG